MKTIFLFMFLFFTGMIFLSSCSKESKIDVPLSFTDKDGKFLIQIDTASNSFDAYISIKLTQGRLKGIFNDSIRSSFYLAITTNSFWDTTYHAIDTIVFPTHYPRNTLVFETDIDLTDFTSPYHFLLLGNPKPILRRGAHGNPSIMLTIDTQNY
jgi:hypothetical protein